MAYRTPHQFGKASLPPGLGDLNRGETEEDPIEANLPEEEIFVNPQPTPSIGAVPNPRKRGLARVNQFKQMGSVGGKAGDFFKHPFTHLGVGLLTGFIVADVMSERWVMEKVKSNAVTIPVTVLGTWGILSVINK